MELRFLKDFAIPKHDDKQNTVSINGTFDDNTKFLTSLAR